jgi:hypothetical protein
LATFIGSIDLPAGSAASWERMVSWIGVVMRFAMPRIALKREARLARTRRRL